MNIGIDLDGVLYDSENYFRAFAEIFDIAHDGNGPIDRTQLRMRRRYGWNNEMLQEYLDLVTVTSVKRSNLKNCAREVIDYLRASGHKLIVISARGKFGDEEVVETKKRFERDNLKFDKYCFYSLDKVQTCKDEKIDIMIEDYFKVASTLCKNKIKCLYFREAISPKIKSKYIFEVENWGEIYRYFYNLNPNKEIKIKLK